MKVKKNKVNIVTNKEKGVIVAYATNCRYDAIDAILRKSCIKYLRASEHLTPELKAAIMNSSYRGIAKCHPDDTFDEEKGIALATERLNKKYERAYKKAISSFFNRQIKKTLYT